MLKDIPAAIAPTDPDGEVTDFGKPDLDELLGTDMTFELSENAFKPTIQEGISSMEVAKVYKSYTSPASKMFYAISAIVAIIGALRVLQTWNQGNDISKSIVAWGGTSLFLVIVGYFIQLFFK